MNKYYLSLILSCLLLSFSCSKTEPAKPTIVEKQENDSISIWIDESYNANSERKLELQNKAFQLAKNTSNDTLKSKYFSNLSFNQQFLSDSLLFRKINKEAILINKQIKDSTALGYAYWDLAYFFDNHIVKDSSFYFYTEALNIFTGIGDRAIIGRMYLNMAGIQMKIKDYVGSEANTIKAIENFKIIEDNEKLYRCYNLLGIVLGDLKDYDKSLAYYNEALFYLEKTPNSTIEKASVSNNIGVNYRHLKLYDKAIHNFENVLKINNLHIKHPSLFAKAISNLATSKLYAQDTLNVENLFKKSIEIKKEENELASLSSSYFNYAEYKAYAKDTINAIEKLKKSEKLARESSSNEQLLKTWQYLAILDKNNASDYFKKFTKLNDSLLSEERKQQNKFARIRFETDEFIAENIELESEKQVLSKQKQIWIGIATGFFLLGLSVYIIINQRAKNQKLRFDQQQQANNQEIFNLMLMQKQKVDEVKRLEQKRISEELHDGVLGKMLGARMILTGLNKRATDEAIQEKSKALGSLQEIENEIRAISHELSHSAYQKISNFT
ncbi:histidine kinase, partial [Maribacter dokdonensis]